MAKLSICIPSRDEQFLIPTIDDVFAHASQEIEVVAVLDSNQWPAGWKEVTERHPNLHTVHHGAPRGMRAAINSGVASAVSRGAIYIMKLDGHCSLSEGFDTVLLSEIEDDWVVVPRRGRLDPENWCATETHKPDIDYHYLSFPDNPSDWGGAGLNGKPWDERAKQRVDILVDDECSTQGSCWLTSAKNFERLELMDEAAFGPFWAEAQEVLMKNWLSGGRCVVNKKAKYLHLHKGKKYGRGYRLAESALVQGRNQAMKWIHNDAWSKQTHPFSWLVEKFWPMPGWPDNWRKVLYGEKGEPW
jgi:GT2 family glycosyltransferase